MRIKKRVLITGGSGFIGRNLVEGLQEEYQIFAPSHRELPVENYVLLGQYLADKDIDVIVHAAIQGGEKVLESTLRMFASILRNLGKVEKVIHCGSGAEYAKTRDLKKIKEQQFGQFIPVDNYGLAKYICSTIAKNKERIVNLRIFGIYGRYEDYRYKFISNSIVKNLLGLPIKIKQDVIFDYLYIDDFVQIVKHFIDEDWKYSNYNITPTESISLKEIVDIINEVSKSSSPVSIINKGLNFQYTGDNSRLKKEIPEFVFTSYRNGIRKLCQYYKMNIDELDQNAIIQDDYLTKAKVKK